MMSFFKSLKIKFRVVGLFSAAIEKIDAETQSQCDSLDGEGVASTAIETERDQAQIAKHSAEYLLSRPNQTETERK